MSFNPLTTIDYATMSSRHPAPSMAMPVPSTGPRRQSTAPRGPPMLPAGMPVKAEVAHKQTFHNQSQNQRPPPGHQSIRGDHTLHLPNPHQPPMGQNHNQQTRMSMPPPRTTTGHRTAPRGNGHGSQQASSQRAFDPSLRESTRFNSDASSSRSGSTAGKSSYIQTPEELYKAKLQDVDTQFDQLLDNLQVASSVREKFQTVSMDVKSSILTNSVNSNSNILNSLGLPVPPQSPKIKKRLSAPLLRKVKSSSSLGGGVVQQDVGVGRTCNVHGDEFIIVASPMSPPLPQSTRGQSFDIPRQNSARPTNGPRPISGIFSSSSAASARGLGISVGEGPDAFISWLKAYKGTDLRMDVDRMKKLRMLLRHESTVWVQTFLEMGGYELILARMQDVLDIEWREEQHDDKMLYELLRCIKAFTTTEIGKNAIRQHYPNPFPGMSALLFSEKKPGDLACRQLIIELWIYLFELYPSSPIVPHHQLGARPNSVRFDTPPLPAHVRATTDVHKLLSPDQPDPTADQHQFITSIHRPKVFKAWVGELSDICRDYFWIMCHGTNTLWALDQVDEKSVERPVAPGGATGGVEFEAMNYVTIHFKLLNTLCRTQAAEDREKATQLHFDLLTSGMDRILVTMRKASTTYYPTLHLELARYVELLRTASPSGKLPHLIDKMVGSPPEHLRRFDQHPFGR